jgi:hypothetical protein
MVALRSAQALAAGHCGEDGTTLQEDDAWAFTHVEKTEIERKDTREYIVER